VTAGNRLYWCLVHAAAIVLGIYGAVRFFEWAN
jgi:hypothetical protein